MLYEVESGHEVWQIALSYGDVAVDWSDSGELLGIVNNKLALVVDRDGRVLVERRRGAVELVTLSDAEVGRRETATWREQLAFDR
jgi:hypothetical protein